MPKKVFVPVSCQDVQNVKSKYIVLLFYLKLLIAGRAILEILFILSLNFFQNYTKRRIQNDNVKNDTGYAATSNQYRQ